MTALDDAMARLRAAERECRAAIDELIRLKAIRSQVLVGDLGELIAARYSVTLPSPFTPGYDLVDRQGNRVQVKTRRATPTRPRKIIGEVRDPCDVVLAIRLDFDYAPTEALEIPRAVADKFVGKNGKVSWTHKLVAHPDVRHISIERPERPSDRAGAQRLARALGYLPLALSHAAAYCATGTSFDDYHELLEALPADQLFDRNPEASSAGGNSALLASSRFTAAGRCSTTNRRSNLTRSSCTGRCSAGSTGRRRGTRGCIHCQLSTSHRRQHGPACRCGLTGKVRDVPPNRDFRSHRASRAGTAAKPSSARRLLTFNHFTSLRSGTMS